VLIFPVCISDQQIAQLPVVEGDVGELRAVRREGRLPRIGQQQGAVAPVGRDAEDALRRIDEVAVVERQPLRAGNPGRVGRPVARESGAYCDAAVGGAVHPRHRKPVHMSPRLEVRDIASVRRPKRSAVVLRNAEPPADPAARIRDDDLAPIRPGSSRERDVAAARRPRRATDSPARCQPHGMRAVGANDADPAVRRDISEQRETSRRTIASRRASTGRN
jgi:hypothetical protein